MTTEIINDETIMMDRLALSRAQHFKFRNNRPKSVSDDEIDAVSDWSESDRECCPLSDFESISNTGGNNHYDLPFDDDDDQQQQQQQQEEVEREEQMNQRLSGEPALFEHILCRNETPLPNNTNSPTSTRISFSSDIDKSKQTFDVVTAKPPIQIRKPSQTPLLPARRIPTKDIPRRRSITTPTHVLVQSTNVSRNHKTAITSPTRISLRRETTSININSNPLPPSAPSVIKETTASPNSSFHSSDDNNHHQQRHISSPNFSQTSISNPHVPRVYEVKKLFVDDYDYGRLTDVSNAKTLQARNRQKWGTIVHPPFPLGYQQISPEQVTQAVERLTSPVRCRDRHTPVQTPTKRYLSVEETDALINRLTKVKPLRSPEEYWPVRRQSRPVKNLNNTLKTTNNWKGVGISA